MEHRISVLMGIYNCEKTLSKAIDSILSQTYTNIELVMCDDGSNDNTYQIANRYFEKYRDKIILIKNEKNQGLNITLNRCLKASSGDLIARQDADDSSLPERFEKQVKYLDEHPTCAFVSTGMIVNDGIKIIGNRMPSKLRPERYDVMRDNQFFHAPVMIRRGAILAVNGYTEDKRLLRVEDYNLWVKLYAKGYYGENIMVPLYNVCEDNNTYLRRNFQNYYNSAYALWIAVDMLKLSKWYKIFAVKKMMKGLIPNFIYRYLHKSRMHF